MPDVEASALALPLPLVPLPLLRLLQLLPPLDPLPVPLAPDLVLERAFALSASASLLTFSSIFSL